MMHLTHLVPSAQLPCRQIDWTFAALDEYSILSAWCMYIPVLVAQVFLHFAVVAKLISNEYRGSRLAANTTLLAHIFKLGAKGKVSLKWKKISNIA
jgi:hypothetical protein